ncbi:prepilin-type N-terminal cleavage/methylation domain-containing protein [Lentibacillus salinarum]|uniref:Prepilin-type N-terminal cleavage/methylation domain-containing protein n=1 Tax=Lentibacillus salinarum TaxID=446820 RepID=A0ABW3ZXE0_9BACI
MKNSKGFSLIESLAAVSLLMMIIATIIPASSLLLNEREVLQQKRHMIHQLHLELQPFLRESTKAVPNDFSKIVNGSEATFRFVAEDNLLKGCVIWDNDRNRTDQFCLYGYPD